MMKSRCIAGLLFVALPLGLAAPARADDVADFYRGKRISLVVGYGTGGGYVGAGDALREALAANPQLGVVVAHGMTDLVTPYMTSRFAIARLPPSLTEGRVTLSLYAGGHMMYLRSASRARLHADAAKLYPVPPL